MSRLWAAVLVLSVLYGLFAGFPAEVGAAAMERLLEKAGSTTEGVILCLAWRQGLTREEIESYRTALEEAGFSPCGEDAGLELSESGVTVGDLFYWDGIYCSVSATDLEEQNSLVIYIAGLAE